MNYDDDPDFKAWVKRNNEILRPMIRDSAFSMTLLSDAEPDAKIAVELGFAILMDKPLMFLVHPGTPVPKHLARVADHIIEVDINDPGAQELIGREIKAFTERFGLAG